jgi:putative nucleotidyltransferase with HDIG domain
MSANGETLAAAPRSRVALAGDLPLTLFVCGLASSALVLFVALVAAGYGLGFAPGVAVVALAALLAERTPIRLTATTEASTTSIPFIFAGAIFGPTSAMVVGAVAVLPYLASRDDAHPYLRWLNWTAARALAAGAAGCVAWWLAGSKPSASFGVLLAAIFAASTVDAIVDLVVACAVNVVRRREPVRAVAAAVGPLFIASVPLYAPVIALLVYAYRSISPWSAALFVIPTFAAQRLFMLYQHQRNTATELVVANNRLERANLSFASALVATLDARDQYTAGHSAAVAIYARDIAERMHLPETEQQEAHLCGLVHDIGKIGLPPGLLEKPGALSLDERRQMESHSVIGERILSKVDDYAEIARVVRHHHERVDGFGYPDGLRGEDIPLIARIIAVADAYNAMTSDRPYRDAMPSRVARLRLAQAVESQFDTTVVAAFEAILASADEGYRTGSAPDFVFDVQDDAAVRLAGVA